MRNHVLKSLLFSLNNKFSNKWMINKDELNSRVHVSLSLRSTGFEVHEGGELPRHQVNAGNV